MPKVSVISCLYNVESFLKEGRLKDVYSQIFTDWELILVDDGSTDGTSAFCDNEAARDPRVKVIHKENGGLGSARNAGLEAATGEYICGFDVDDHLEPNMLEICVREMDSRGVDIMMFSFRALTPALKLSQDVHLIETAIDSQDDLRKYYVDRLLLVPNGNGFFWNKCYRRTFLEANKLRFGDERIQQDEIFNIKMLQCIKSCYLSPEILYNYYIFESGNNRSRFIPNRFEIYKSVYNAFRCLQKEWNLNDNRLDDYLYRRLFVGMNVTLRFNLMHPDCNWSKNRKKQEIERVMNDEDVQKSIAYVLKSGLGIEDRLYLNSYCSGSICVLKIVNVFFSVLHDLKRCLMFGAKKR